MKVKANVRQSLALLAAMKESFRQLQRGASIGRRELPVISVWTMKPHWERRHWYWVELNRTDDEEIYTSNNAAKSPTGKPGRFPSTPVRLHYWKVPYTKVVCQLAVER